MEEPFKMTCDIFYRSYVNDFNWLAYSLKSVKKYGHGFGKVHIVVPASDIGFMPVLDGEIHVIRPKSQDGYMDQQITKLHADEFCQSEYVWHMDSDCILIKDVSPLDLFLDGKPVLLREKCDSPWINVSARDLGWYDEYEYMRRLPICYPRRLYKHFRDFMAAYHRMNVDDYIRTRNGHEFSEFNNFGQWAYEFYRDDFTWLEPKDFPTFCKQYRSWDGLNDKTRAEIERLLADSVD